VVYGIYILTNGKVMVIVRSTPAAEDEKVSSSPVDTLSWSYLNFN
jgi:hypothetical protein